MKMDVCVFFLPCALITALAESGGGGVGIGGIGVLHPPPLNCEIFFKKLLNEAKVKDREEKEKIHLYNVNIMNQK